MGRPLEAQQQQQQRQREGATGVSRGTSIGIVYSPCMPREGSPSIQDVHLAWKISEKILCFERAQQCQHPLDLGVTDSTSTGTPSTGSGDISELCSPLATGLVPPPEWQEQEVPQGAACTILPGAQTPTAPCDSSPMSHMITPPQATAPLPPPGQAPLDEDDEQRPAAAWWDLLAKARESRRATSSAVTARRGEGCVCGPAGSQHDDEATLMAIEALLAPDSSLKAVSAECFRSAAAVDSVGLDVDGLGRFTHLISQMLHLPETIFGDQDRRVSHARYDLDGSGRLLEHETYIFVESHLAARCKRLCESRAAPHVAHKWSTPAAAGYELVDEIGHGSQSTVHLTTGSGGAFRCVKRFKKQSLSDISLKLLGEEYSIMSSFGGHPRITAALDIFQDPDCYYVVQEHNAGGDFTKLRSRVAESGLLNSEAWWRDLFQQCFEGLAHLHQHGVIHCDIKEANLMLRTANFYQPEVTIIDFGISQSFTTDRGSTTYGTPGYIPPEVWDTRKWFPRSDIFSMGVVLLQMLTDKVPDHDSGRHYGIFTAGARTYRDVAEATKTLQPPIESLPLDFVGLHRLSTNLLAKSLTKRPTALQVLNDPWFTKLACFGPNATKFSGQFLKLGVEALAEPVLIRVMAEKDPLAPVVKALPLKPTSLCSGQEEDCEKGDEGSFTEVSGHGSILNGPPCSSQM